MLWSCLLKCGGIRHSRHCIQSRHGDITVMKFIGFNIDAGGDHKTSYLVRCVLLAWELSGCMVIKGNDVEFMLVCPSENDTHFIQIRANLTLSIIPSQSRDVQHRNGRHNTFRIRWQLQRKAMLPRIWLKSESEFEKCGLVYKDFLNESLLNPCFLPLKSLSKMSRPMLSAFRPLEIFWNSATGRQFQVFEANNALTDSKQANGLSLNGLHHEVYGTKVVWGGMTSEINKFLFYFESWDGGLHGLILSPRWMMNCSFKTNNGLTDSRDKRWYDHRVQDG